MKKEKIVRILRRIAVDVAIFFIIRLIFGFTRLSTTVLVTGIAMILFQEFSKEE